MRKIFASREISAEALRFSNKKIQVFSFFPIDRANCDCRTLILEWKEKLAKASSDDRRRMTEKQGCLICPHDKTGMRRRIITCKNCGEVLGYCWASDNTLRDWCDFHYVQWTDGKEWHGCLTPHISPITQELCLECCCGEDTRDFRANMTLNKKVAYQIEEKNKIGREFGKKDSKFEARMVKVDVLPFNIQI